MRITITILLVMIAQLGFSQIKRTIHKTYTVENMSSVMVDIEQEVEVTEWKGSRLLIETSISLEGANKQIVEYLIEAGRYDVEEQITGNCLKLELNNLRNRILVRNAEVVEKVKLKIFVPEGLNINQPIVVSGI